MEIVVRTEHKLTARFNLSMDDSAIATESDLGSDGLLNLRNPSGDKGQDNKVEARCNRRSPEDFCFVVGCSFKRKQLRSGKIALQRNVTQLRCKRAHHAEKQSGPVTSIKTVSVGHDERIQNLGCRE